MSEFTGKLADLQHMTRVELERAFPQRNSSARSKGYKINLKALIETIILAAKELHLPLKEDSGVREFWYNPVKPILLVADFERVDKKTHMWEGIFDRILSKMVKAKRLTYADLGISDFRTLRENYEQIDKAVCWSHVLLFPEKDQAYVHLILVKKLLNCNMISGGGWSHTAGIEAQIRELLAKGITWVDVYTFTDYDAFGFAISEEFVGKCETLGLHVRNHVRIGINPSDLAPEVLAVQKYRIKSKRKLTVNGVSFDAAEWLEKYGIKGADGKREYGLEIEAVSAQPGGSQKLRLIVTKALLEHLKESDRITEITQKAWERVPFTALSDLMYGIDGNEVDPKDLIESPTEVPRQFLTRQGYNNLACPIVDEKEEATQDIDSEISDLESQLDDLRTEKEGIEQPFNDKISALSRDYWKSRKFIVYHLFQYYLAHESAWPRKNYSLGFPEGCLITNLEKENDARTMQDQLDTREPIEHISKAFKDVMSNGELMSRIENHMKELAEKKPDEKPDEKPDDNKEPWTDVLVDGEYMGECPKCGTLFEYDPKNYVGILVRCAHCGLDMKLKRGKPLDEEDHDDEKT